MGGETRGIGRGAKERNELGGGALPGRSVGEEGLDGGDDRGRRRGDVDGIAEPGGIGEGSGEMAAESAEDLREGLIDRIEDGLVEIGNGDGKGSGGRRSEVVVIDGEEDGTADPLMDEIIGGGVFAPDEADAGGELAESGGEAGGESGDAIEGENEIVAGESAEPGGARGKREKRGGAGIDDGAENARGERFAGTAEDEDGQRAGIAKGEEQPGENAAPGLGIEAEGGAKRFERIGGLGREVGFGQIDGVSGGIEGDLGGGGDGAGVGSDFDELAGGVGEIDVELGCFGTEVAAAGNADVRARGGLGFEVAVERGERVGGGDRAVGLEKLAADPIAEGARADGESARAIDDGVGEPEKSAAIGGGEREAVLDECEERGNGGGIGESRHRDFSIRFLARVGDGV